MTTEQSICLVGGGAAGLALARVLHERGIPFTWYEKGSRLGGLWVYNNDSGLSAAYQSLTTNTSRTTMGFPGFPLPSNLPDFPTHDQVLHYLDSFVEHFKLGSLVTLGCAVEKIEPAAAGGYIVLIRHLSTGERARHTFRHVIVGTGMFWEPVFPRLEGDFEGDMIHSLEYRDPAVLHGKRVLVIGAGPSGADIAVEAAKEAERAILSLRHGIHVMRRYGKDGVPGDTKNSPFLGLLPWQLRQRILSHIVKALPGFPDPPYGVLQAKPLAHEFLGHFCENGPLVPKPGIARVAGHTVYFVDGTSEDVDLIIAATGFRQTLPFLAPELDRATRNSDGEISLYLNVVAPSLPDLYFVGYVKQMGPVLPSCHNQALYIADLIQGVCQLPSLKVMEKSMEDRGTKGQLRYGHRYTPLMVDLHRYWLELAWARQPRGFTWWQALLWRWRCLLSVLQRPAAAPDMPTITSGQGSDFGVNPVSHMSNGEVRKETL